MKETFAQAAERHDVLANEAHAQAERIKASAPAGKDGRAMREQASNLRMRGHMLRDAANSLLQIDGVRLSGAQGLFVNIDVYSFGWAGVTLCNGLVEFEECNFRGVPFVSCDLRQVKFSRCDLRDAKFYETNVAGLRIVDCNIDGLWFGDEEEFYKRQYARSSLSAYCWNGGYIGSDTRGVIHSGCTGTAIGLDYVEDKWNSGLGATSAAYRASRND